MIITKDSVEANPLSELADHSFAIEDTAFIFDILRNKMYSDKKMALCREYISNAYDANVEAGNESKPLEISLPRHDDLYLKIKDFGPGISEDRMKNIFTKYGSSTKRNSNNQIGGFGIGCKVGFAYTDSFSIITNVNGIKYNYNCFIDDTQVGKVICLSQTETNDPNGTEIIIPIKQSDISYINDNCNFVVKHFKVKPLMINSGIPLNNPYLNKTFENDYSFLTTESSGYGYSRGCALKILVGQLEYKYDEYDSYAYPYLYNSITGTLYLKFNVGDLNLSSSRENLMNDANNKTKIKKAIDDFILDYKKEISDAINNSTSYLDACDYIREDLNKDFPNFNISNTNLSYGTEKLDFNDKYSYSLIFNNYKVGSENKIICYNSYFIYSKKIKYFFNDTDKQKLTTSDIKKLFLNENDELDKDKNICIINKKYTNSDIETSVEDLLKKSDIKSNLIEIENISDFLNVTNNNKSFTRTVIYKYNQVGKYFYSVKLNDLKEDKGNKCYVMFYKSFNKKVIKSNKHSISEDKLFKLNDYSIYAMEQKGTTSEDLINKIFKDCEKYEDVVNKQFNYEEVKAFDYISRRFDFNGDLNKLSKIKDKLSSNTEISSLLELNKIIYDKIKLRSNIDFEYDSDENNKLAYDTYIEKNPQFNIEEFKIKKTNMYEKYPLLKYLNLYSCLDYPDGLDAIVKYLNSNN